ncbi:xylose isomerase-like protein [Ilyonectria sp. MPI-CAGE-AT-0026]|nr:xylose isomerase-like protein [Ilyonectria sp. MPI-CAGE-AT-0026]
MGIPYPHNSAVIPISFATCSIRSESGAALPEKLKAIHSAGFDAVELTMPDILAYGKVLNGEEPDASHYDAIVEVAKAVNSLAQAVNVGILMLKPFVNSDGWKSGHHYSERKDMFEKVRGWLRVMEALGTDMLQIGPSDSEEDSNPVNDLATDLAKLADMYRHNLGLCLNTFQIAGGEFGDPTTKTGLIENISRAELETCWRASLRELARTVYAEKIFLLQISDAYKMDPPMEESKDGQGQGPRSKWSNDYRPLPFDGGYLPVHDVLRAVLNTRFRGWLSIEVYDSKMLKDTDMEAFTKSAKDTLQNLLLFS